MTLEEDAVLGVLGKVVLRGLELRPLAGANAGLVEIEVDGLDQTTDRVLVLDDTIATRN